MTIRELLRTRRDGAQHSAEALTFLAEGAAKGTIPDYQLSAWLMAAYLNPLTLRETVDLTLAMAASGERIDLTGLPGPWVDKHSTGGVGDKTTIVLLPLLAACGLTVVKMSGRGLGITGGTVDKLESIPGFRTDLSIEEMKAQAGRIGLALTGQTPRLAPADGALYALRDVTETVDSIPLIAASILSKKIAGGATTVVLDVKCGAGAFMTDLEQAHELRRWLVEIGEGCGLRVAARISDMDAPLGETVGNGLEVLEACHVLTMSRRDGPTIPVDWSVRRPAFWRFRGLCVEFAVLALTTSGAYDESEAHRRVEEALASGSAWERARRWFEAQGVPPATLDESVATPEDRTGRSFPATLIMGTREAQITVPHEGWVARIDPAQVADVVLELGGGRRAKGDRIDHAVGVELRFGIGDRVTTGSTGGAFVGNVYARSSEAAQSAARRVAEAIEISPTPVEPPPLFLD